MSKVVKSAAVFFIATMMSKVIGFLRDLAITHVYGAGMVSDAYFAALKIMTIVFMSLLCVAIQSTYMPIYTTVEETKGKQKALKFTSNIINIIFIISLILSIFGWIFTKQIVKVLNPGFEGEKLIITIQLTKILLFSVGSICITYILKSYLEIYNYFLITGLMPLPYNIATIIAVLLSKKFGIAVLGYGTLFAFIIQMLFLIPFCYKKGFKYKFIVNLKDKNVRKMGLAILPILVGASASQINSLVDQSLSSLLVTGSVSALTIAYRLNIFVIGLFVASITSVIYPLFSKLGSEGKIDQLKISFCKSINSVILITMPIAVGALILAEPIIRLLYEHGAFDSNATKMTANVLACYAIGIVAAGMRDVTVRVFYALHDTKIPMRNSIQCVIFNITFNLLLIKYLKVSGLALASSISSILAIVFLMYKLRQKIGKLNAKSMLITFIKTAIASGAMAMIVINIFNVISLLNEKLALVVSIGIGAIVYGMIVLILKVESTDYVINIIKQSKDKLLKRA